jgi:hypothetical protein
MHGERIKKNKKKNSTYILNKYPLLVVFWCHFSRNLILNTVRVPTNLVYLILMSNTPSFSGGASPPEHVVSRGG